MAAHETHNLGQASSILAPATRTKLICAVAKKNTEVPDLKDPETPEVPETPATRNDAVLAVPVKEFTYSVKVQGYVRVQATDKDMAEEHVRSMTLEEFAENRAKIILVRERALAGDDN